jgi:SagB-type dehydrogenase family enzyme
MDDAGALPEHLTGTRFRLSRHALLRPDQGGFVLETSLSAPVRRVDSRAVLGLLLELARPVWLADVLAAVDGGGRAALLAFLEGCVRDGLLTPVDGEGRGADETGPLAHWQPPDLLFHARSRRGRTAAPVGASYPLRGVVQPEPELRPDSAEASIALPVPDLAALERGEAPLTRVLEARRSRYGTAPVSVAELGELLYRSFRVTGVEDVAGADRVVKKVYPSAGSRHPLEMYVVPWDCTGLPRAAYRYHPVAHALEHVAPFDPQVEALLEDARAGTGCLKGYPPVLLVVSARFRRTMFKYQSLAYGAILKEVGGLFQTLYLVATSMGLSPCAIGAGDSDRFARVMGTDYYDETSVGEFIVAGPGGETGLQVAERAAAVRAAHAPS